MKVKFKQTPRIASVGQQKWNWALYDDEERVVAFGPPYADWRECVRGFELATGASVFIERQHVEDGSPVVLTHASREVVPQVLQFKPGIAVSDRDRERQYIEVEGLA